MPCQTLKVIWYPSFAFWNPEHPVQVFRDPQRVCHPMRGWEVGLGHSVTILYVIADFCFFRKLHAAPLSFRGPALVHCRECEIYAYRENPILFPACLHCMCMCMNEVSSGFRATGHVFPAVARGRANWYPTSAFSPATGFLFSLSSSLYSCVGI